MKNLGKKTKKFGFDFSSTYFYFIAGLHPRQILTKTINEKSYKRVRLYKNLFELSKIF